MRFPQVHSATAGSRARLRWILKAALCLGLLQVACAASDAGRTWPSWLAECERSGFGMRLPSGSRCGRLPVWEDREAASGRRIEIAVAVVPRWGPRSAAATVGDGGRANSDPVRGSGAGPGSAVFYFMGGPGGSAIAAAPAVVSLLEPLRRERDLVFVDQRGTGSSAPLRCPAPQADWPAQEILDSFLDPESVARCRAQPSADVTLYTTPIAMDDVDEVRAALGYDRIDLYGGSYGTRAAQVYLRRHPESVRAVVLKGVAPMDMENPLPFSRALDRGLARLIEDCAADLRCRRAFPDLAGDWRRVVERFEAGPVRAQITDLAGRSAKVTLSQGVFADGLRHLLYTVHGSRRLPAILHAASKGDFAPFVERELEQTIGFGRSLSHGMFLTVTCSEDVQFVTEEEVARATAGTFLGDYRIRRQQEACRIWGVGKVPVDYQEPVKVDRPVLLISGELDTATPPEGGERVASQLPNARHLVVPNQSHGSANFQCEQSIVVEFLRRGSHEGLDVECLEETRRPPFEVR